MRDARIVRRLLRTLKDNPDNARQHSKKQLKKLADAMSQIGFIGVIIIDENDTILAGHGRRAAALMAGIDAADCVVVDHLTQAQKRAFALFDNKIGLDSSWDLEKVSLSLAKIVELDINFDLSMTGFDARELDEIAVALHPDDKAVSLQDERLPEIPEGEPVSKVGDRILLGDHVLVCGDSRAVETFRQLMGAEQATMVVSDPPYNVRINGHVGGSGKIAQREFVMASGEMSETEFTAFLTAVIEQCAAFSIDGSIHYHFMDWRHMGELLAAGHSHYTELKNVIVWDKGVGGMGTFYRSRHEMIFVFKNGKAPHINTFDLGSSGRYRTNVWTYRGLNTGGAHRQEELSLHPTAKPVQMLADAMLDCSRRGSIVLDPFGGSGSTLIAAEKTGRRARLIELDPIYVDRIVRRWQIFAKDDAVFTEAGESFDERQARLTAERRVVAHIRAGARPTSRIVTFPKGACHE